MIMTKHIGFTLIDLIVAVAIVGLLVAIALPSYTAFVQKARRSDATSALVQLAIAQEKHRSNNPQYTADFNALNLSTTSVEGPEFKS